MAKLAHRALPPLQLLEDLLMLTPESPSWLSWRNPRSRKLKPGDHAGWQDKSGSRNTGYFQVGIRTDGKDFLFLGHRLVYFLHYKIDPGNFQVDHIDGNKFNHNPLNLRLASDSQNKTNVHKRNHHTSSRFKGVCRNKRSEVKPWMAYIDWQKKRQYLGTFASEEEAAVAYNQAACRLHGSYAFLNDLSVLAS